MTDYDFEKLDLPGADVQICYNFLASPPSVDDVNSNVVFNSDEESKVFIHGKYIQIPRKQVGYGNDGTFYRFSGNRVDAKPWNDFLEDIELQLEAVLEETFNFVLINLYEDGTRYIGWHSDDEKDLGDGSIIASLTFGATRDFVLKHKVTKKSTKIALPHNTLLIMGGDTQKNYLHSVPKRLRVKEPRINMTWRQMVT
jgi:alkylated DNA repair dioxygenase AlkB